MSIDGSSYVTVSNVAGNSPYYPFFSISTRTSSTKSIKVDYFGFIASGVSR